MKNKKSFFSIGRKMYIFIIITVLSVGIGTALISYYINTNQIDKYYKKLASNSAKNYSTLVDKDFLKELKEIAQSEEYQAVRDAAEEADDEQMVEDYFKEIGYYEEREPEFNGVKADDMVDPTISEGDWGWLCSAYYPVYDDDGSPICLVGCDIAMDNVMAERHRNLLYIIIGAAAVTVLVVIFTVILIKKYGSYR